MSPYARFAYLTLGSVALGLEFGWLVGVAAFCLIGVIGDSIACK